jgi:hypothetical protein
MTSPRACAETFERAYGSPDALHGGCPNTDRRSGLVDASAGPQEALDRLCSSRASASTEGGSLRELSDYPTEEIHVVGTATVQRIREQPANPQGRW